MVILEFNKFTVQNSKGRKLINNFEGNITESFLAVEMKKIKIHY